MKQPAMIPKRMLFLGLLSLLFGTGAFAQGISVQLDGRNLYFDQPPAMIDGRLLVPLRGIFEALSADVLYDASTRSIKATKGTTVVQLQLGSRTALIDGRTVYLDVPADTVGGRTMVPLRFVSESLGADVKWSGATKTVVIASGGGGVTPPNVPNPPQAGAPKIDRIVHNGTTPMNPGDALEVVIYGDSGGRATFEILGHTQEISVPEISSGRYQTRYSIPAGLKVQKGVLLAHLNKNGQETAKEADRQITIRAGNNNNNNNNNNNGNWQTYPESNSTVNSVRPQLAITFPESIQNGTYRLYVDGIDFTQQARLSGNQLLWQPQYDLAAGRHQAQVRASGNSGQTLDYQWAFNLDANSGNTSGNLAVQELRPANGQVTTSRPSIGAIFNQNISSATLVVDNVNVTNQQGVQRYSNGITWTPSYDMQNGTHQATVTGVDSYSRQVTQSWNFSVGSGSSGINGQTLTVSNISNGSLLPPVFNVQGGATPGRQVNVLVEYSPNNILEVITGQTRQASQSVLVGGNGRFDVQIDASSIRSGQTFRITVTDGGSSPSLVYNVRRQ
jgi:hypothetical protein